MTLKRDVLGPNFDSAMLPSGESLGALGDPQRWGSVARVTVSTITTGTKSGETKQLLRAQVPRLQARRWSLFATYQIILPVGSTLSSLLFDGIVGIGQAAQPFVAQIYPVPVNTASPFSSAAVATQGTVDLGEIPAASINARIKWFVDVSMASLIPPSGQLILGLQASPRSL